MNTLPKGITHAFFENADGFERLQRHWSGLVNGPSRHELKAVHFLLYQALRGKDWRRGFGPVRDPNKLANGYVWKLQTAMALLRSPWARERVLEPFAGVVSSEAVDRLLVRLPAPGAGLPDAAYRDEEAALVA